MNPRVFNDTLEPMAKFCCFSELELVKFFVFNLTLDYLLTPGVVIPDILLIGLTIFILELKNGKCSLESSILVWSL